MADMRSIATAVESYEVDFNFYPKVASGVLQGITTFIQPTYIKRLPTDDGWNQPLLWMGDTTVGTAYTIWSQGKGLAGKIGDGPGQTTALGRAPDGGPGARAGGAPTGEPRLVARRRRRPRPGLGRRRRPRTRAPAHPAVRRRGAAVRDGAHRCAVRPPPRARRRRPCLDRAGGDRAGVRWARTGGHARRRAAAGVRAGWGSLLVLAGVAVAMSRSLAAVGVAGALLVALLARRRMGRAGVAAAAALVVLAAAVLAGRGDLAHLDPLQLRWLNWRTAAWVFLHHPWLGVGLGGIGQAGLTAPTGAANITPYAHCTPLELLAELGVAGVPLLVAGAWALARLLRLGWREHPALALAVATVPLHNLVDFSAYRPEVLLPWAVLAGSLASRVWPAPRRPVPAPALTALLAGGALLAALSWRSEAAVSAAAALPPAAAAETALAAARWAPWTVTPVEMAAGYALEPGPATALALVDGELAARWWVQPLSAAWAEARARLLLAQGRPGEALVWVREARRRAPWRGDLAQLEAACARPR
ncbi:MAG: hypothetical protein B7Z61_14090 [Acidobacteria bacterium 37-71-11]|nr:MAG: hypothetical protein B7Z61_14090 [Acidobacteria bacterium 37-71-11]